MIEWIFKDKHKDAVVLSIIHNDHKNIAKLLNVLTDKLSRIKLEDEVDYRLVRDIVSYLQTYSGKFHHPLEDRIYEYYLKYRVVDDSVANRLHDEHQHLEIISAELKEMIDSILLDAIVSRDDIIEKLQQFVNLQKAHLDYEEVEILPAIKASLSADDWRHLEQNWHHDPQEDPLFGRTVADQYKSLAKRLSL
nr:hemerythrin domain-containing protein [Motilimonas cestriensis]